MPCVNFGLFSSGCDQTSRNTIDISSVTQNITNTVQNSLTTNNVQQVTLQSQNIRIFCTETAQNITINQNASLNITTDVSLLTDLSNNVVSSTLTNLSNSLSSQNSSIQGFLSQYPNASSSVNELKNTITTLSQNDTFIQSVTSSVTELLNIQEQGVDIKARNCDGIEINQTTVLDAVVNNVAETIISNVIENENVATAIANVQSKMTSEGKGVAEALKALLGPIVIIVLIIIAGVVAFFVFGKTENIKATGDVIKSAKGM